MNILSVFNFHIHKLLLGFIKKKIFFYLLGDLLVIPFFVEFKIEPSRLKLDWRTIFIEFFGGNGGGDGSFNCSTGLCLPQRPIIIVYLLFKWKMISVESVI